jgi:transposase
MSDMASDRPKRRPRRKFTDEFKEHAARLVLDDGRTLAQVARELDLVPTALREWVERARTERRPATSRLTAEERDELARLRKQVRALEEDREILKKAAAFFAKHQR